MARFKKVLSLFLTMVMLFTTVLSTGMISQASLLPLEEVKAYLVLNGKTDEELSKMNVDDVIGMLKDSEGNPISVSEKATTVWRYVKSEDDGIEEYTPYSIGKGETIDLSTEKDINIYTVELIIGSSSQLDRNNIRYLVTVFVTDTVREELTYQLYMQDENGQRKETIPERVTSSINTQTGFEVTTNEYTVPELQQGQQYYLGITSSADEHPYLRTEVYDFAEFINAIIAGGGSFESVEDVLNSIDPLSDSLLHQDMQKTNAGLPINYDEPKMFIVAYFDQNNHVGNNFSMISFTAVPDSSYIHGSIYSKNGNEFTDIVCLDADHIGFPDIDSIFAGKGVHELCLMLKEGYDPNTEFYCVLSAHGREYGDEANRKVVKAVQGHYDSLEDAASCPDIKDQLIPVDQNSDTRGYKGVYNYKNGGVPFTVFFEDGNVWKLLVLAMEYTPKYDENYFKPFTEKPIIGEADPWFRVTGASDKNGNKYDTYVIENGKSINMDTYYGYGYQTVFINDAEADLSALKPDFWYANTDRVYAVSKDTGEKVDENHIRDFSQEDQQYTGVILDNNKENERNYWVTFKKLNNNGPELFVYGPSEREVILDEYFEFKHDILIANIGNAPLEDLSVELLDAENVKLDPYWTVGGQQNDTLAPFKTTSTSTQYGELPNMAKIRLLPDGDGEVKGTLVIRAKDQKPVMITLNGKAQNPEIVTETIADAVKYVPYQQIIATNDMHDWIETQFSIVDGELPEGVTLNSDTGEIYGVPTVPDGSEEVTYRFTVEAQYLVEGQDGYFEPSYKEYELVVKPNTDGNVYLSTDSEKGYCIKQPIGTQTGDYSFELNEIADTVFTSNGEYGEFSCLWLNGKPLEPGVDYDSESGSTKITIKSQTFKNKADKDGTNTIAMEFRKDTDGDGKGDSGAEMNRTAQNFTIKTQADKDREAANRVIALIASIPSTVTLYDKNTISHAREAYDDLTPAQQKLVSNYSRLIRAENAIKQLEQNYKDKAAADKVVKMIESLPTPITLDSKNAVNAARNAYNMLTASQKGYVSNYKKLQEAENAIAALEKEEGKTESVTFVGIVVDKNGKAAADRIVEIHSSVQTSRTDENGSFQFNDVEFGKHTISVKNTNGKLIAQKTFTLKDGSPLSINGNEIIAEAGSVFTVRIQLDNQTLTFLNVQEGNKAPVIDTNKDDELSGIDIGGNSQTGDEGDQQIFWYILLFASLVGLLITFYFDVKMSRYAGKHYNEGK